MAFVENLDQFFEETDFAVGAVITKTAGGSVLNISAILNTPTQSVEIFDTNIETDAPNLVVKTADVPGVKNRDTVLVDGKNYSIERVSHDGTGVSTLFLK